MATNVNDVIENKDYIPVHNHGFVGIAQEEDENGNLYPSVMGNDKSIVRAARISYGKDTKKVSNDENLIRYLMRHNHTTPFEMVEFKFHCKMPIFVARQWVRHRTANINEYSGRYSEMVDDFYLPQMSNIQPQSTTNKQGREGDFTAKEKITIQEHINESNTQSYNRYKRLLEMGVSRELARTELNLNNYSEWIWKIDLHNLFHFLHLRMDSHAQVEIREYANAMYKLIKKYVPIACKAFEDYKLNAVSFSANEVEVITSVISDYFTGSTIKEEYSLPDGRETKEFLAKIKAA